RRAWELDDTEVSKCGVGLKVARRARGHANEPEVNRRRPQRTGAQFGMELGRNEVRVSLQLQHLHASTVVRAPDEPEARILEFRDVRRIDLVEIGRASCRERV